MEIVTSFLLLDGRAVRPDLHRARLGCSTAEWTSLEWPATGAWFPRVSRDVATGQVHLRLRPAPPRRDVTRLAAQPVPDPREHPRVKGPDLARLAQVRAGAQEQGADDAVLVGDYGTVHECALGALLMREAGSTWLQGPEEHVLESVTVRAAVEAGLLDVRPARVPCAELGTRELLCASALHGFTAATLGSENDARRLNEALWAAASVVERA